ncbi:hypothetical protein [Marinimicrobium sp. ABcell2]|uniref:hypothetical protein n=1 Tax=Marinimicrobium sp. ABcell2 TaxID=3069751 RepID=UPI0027B5EF8A|nr:hypothetical protein [Marinimicrobium sp. ABcell2]MDQ2078530.1 hypothetical protein [Marinimicrobium sp. ABcell2]
MAKSLIAKLSIGSVLVLFGVLMLHKGVAVMDLDFEFFSESLSTWSEFSPYLLLGFVSSFFGFSLFFSSLSRLSNENL